jgi:predicted Zn finger-like uncharacterized protein
MRIVCPNCSAEYDVPDSLVTAGRVVRCARCGGEWMPVEVAAAEREPVPSMDEPPAGSSEVEPAASAAPPSDMPAADAPLSPSAMDRLALHSVRPSSRLRLRLAWLASLTVLVGLAWATYAWRAEIVMAWPPSARMYSVFGVQPLPGRSP